MARWDWDEFAGGLAQGLLGGAATGSNLAKARDAAREERLRTVLAYPDDVIDAVESRRRNLGAPNLGTMSGQVESGVVPDFSPSGEMATSFRPAPLPEAEARQEARGRQVFHQGRDITEELTQTDADLAQRAVRRRQLETQAKDTATRVDLLSATGAKYRLALRRYDLTKKRLSGAQDPESERAAAIDLERAMEEVSLLQDQVKMVRDSLRQQNIEDDVIDRVIDGGETNALKDAINRGLYGTTRTRSGGARSKP